MATHLDLSDTQIDILAELYAECDTTLDDLPYTDAFERLYTQFLARAGVSSTGMELGGRLATPARRASLFAKSGCSRCAAA